MSEPSPADPQVPEKTQRRRFSAQYKLKILEQAERCRKPGEVGSLLRREGLYSSLLSQWRQQRQSGALAALSRKRGRKKRPETGRIGELERENERLRRKLRQAETIIEVQKKLSQILGLKSPETQSEEGAS